MQTPTITHKNRQSKSILIKRMRQINLSMITNITVNFKNFLRVIFLYDIEHPKLVFLKGVGWTEERGQAGPQANRKQQQHKVSFSTSEKQEKPGAGEMGDEYGDNIGIYVK